jgi:uncharacterized sporulation protein YeaH/YhbH (DUF444 family)
LNGNLAKFKVNSVTRWKISRDGQSKDGPEETINARRSALSLARRIFFLQRNQKIHGNDRNRNSLHMFLLYFK